MRTNPNLRELNDFERQNVAFLTSNDVPYGLLLVTATGLRKSILDATASFREFLQASGIHDYDRQPQGQEFKVFVRATLITDGSRTADSRASLYRPVSKQGDPRIWFRGLSSVVNPNDVFVTVWATGQLWVANISTSSLANLLSTPGAVRDVLGPFVDRKADVVTALRGLLEAIAARGFIPVGVRGDTAIGRLLETELGIQMNSSKKPDYMGIELKSSRRATNKVTLFSNIPDWPNSAYKNASSLMRAFGNPKSLPLQLYCTISARSANPNGLQLSVDTGHDLLHVRDVSHGDRSAVQWDLETLRYRLSVKHNETFWVKGETRIINGWEHIRFRSVEHTRKPIIEQLAPLLADGKVTLDFTINDRAKDHGYLFRTLPKDLQYLFPPSESFVLPASDAIEDRPPIL